MCGCTHPCLPRQKTVAMGSNASLRNSIEFDEIGLLNNELFGTEVQSERDGNTRPPVLPLEKSVCRSGSNS